MSFPDEQFDSARATQTVEDRLSALPECILHHILSFLPLKMAARTSSLGRQWRYLWTRIPDLELNDFSLISREIDKEQRKRSFVAIVEHLLRHRGDLSINRLTLKCTNYCATDHLDSWMQSFSRLGMKELLLWPLPRNYREADNELFELPPRLKLSTKAIECQSLRVIIMSEITFPAQFNGEQFLFNFPCLVDMSFWKCQLPETLNISCPLLKFLCIEDSTVKDLTIIGEELEELTLALEGTGDSLRINAPKLIIFVWFFCYFSQIFLDNVSSVSDVSIMLNRYATRDHNRSHLLQLLHSFSNVESLTMSDECFEALLAQENLHRHLPMFWHLKNLSAELALNEDINRVFFCLMHRCPNLESIKITSFGELDDNETASFRGNNMDFSSSLHGLKTVTFRRIEGINVEFAFLESLLKTAGMLRHLIVEIDSAYTEDSSHIIEKLQKLQTFTHASPNVVISVSIY